MGYIGLPWWLSSKESCKRLAGDTGSIPGSGRSSREGNGNPLQYSCLENLMDEGFWQATVHGVTTDHTERLNNKENDMIIRSLDSFTS